MSFRRDTRACIVCRVRWEEGATPKQLRVVVEDPGCGRPPPVELVTATVSLAVEKLVHDNNHNKSQHLTPQRYHFQSWEYRAHCT